MALNVDFGGSIVLRLISNQKVMPEFLRELQCRPMSHTLHITHHTRIKININPFLNLLQVVSI